MMVEAKNPRDRVSPAQHLMHDAFRAAGIEVGVIRHADIPALIEELKGPRLLGTRGRKLCVTTPEGILMHGK